MPRTSTIVVALFVLALLHSCGPASPTADAQDTTSISNATAPAAATPTATTPPGAGNSTCNSTDSNTSTSSSNCTSTSSDTSSTVEICIIFFCFHFRTSRPVAIAIVVLFIPGFLVAIFLLYLIGHIIIIFIFDYLPNLPNPIAYISRLREQYAQRQTPSLLSRLPSLPAVGQWIGARLERRRARKDLESASDERKDEELQAQAEAEESATA
ncbi:hypothetical protein M427DRAFT_145645 [Gonapodya prolifera JEL478]|uniref:Uncharacterized protein n=1 Tax=Gonapodya prolifera (strain JEL478) TaxID=1344416 RepID=A0A139AF60_GONPJ|nr:hypothetical protein M427DRAFT_145645 [Gonapodya prolifera JEL478]|eukprot:KXS15319.1 hypothetical protein M427DRAFT_145645 [Gonapodya prolifera JEL478]